jgi:hypothetical protein
MLGLSKTYSNLLQQGVDLKGQSHEIFYLWFFSSNKTSGSTDSWATLHYETKGGVATSRYVA